MTLIQNEKQTVLVALALLFSILPTGAVALRIWARRTSGKRLQLSDDLIILDNVAMLAYWVLVIYVTLVAGTKEGDMRTNAELAKTNMDFCLSYHRVRNQSRLASCRDDHQADLGHPCISPQVLHTRAAPRDLLLVFEDSQADDTHPYIRQCHLGVGVHHGYLVHRLSHGALVQPREPPTDMRHMNKVNGIFNAVSAVVLDFAIFCVPIWQLVSVRLKSKKKISVMISFGLGFLTCVVALVRTIIVYQTKPLNALVQEFLLGLEPSVGIIAVCIPLFRRLFHGRGRQAERVKMHRLPSRAGAGDPEDGIKSTTTIVASSQASRPR
ncbi:uncharacterized protein PG986_002837 [Apiospora aurea]|uniref:Rhodopsin domain-containing protein n=1 Tax=Apiospora aurea TaxID=335848 RepID=A0ABR1QPY9_9PEZI